MDELARVKAALKAHGWSWHGSNGTASGRRDMLLAPSRIGWAAGAYETAIHSRDTLPETIEATERELRQLAAVRWSVTRAECAKTNAYALACAELQRRIEAGEPDDVLDVERERLADEWLSMSEEDRARIEGVMR